jgi:hypothetical protein
MNRLRSREKKWFQMLALGGCLVHESHALDLLEDNNRGREVT